jgi:hypothetical protein
MPRIKRTSDENPLFRKATRIAHDLAQELKSERKFGQPRIVEEEFNITGRIRVVVLWDRWEHMTHEDRSNAIINAYKFAESKEFAERIGLVSGLTFPEAHASGMLPFQIIAAPRRGDPVTAEQCREAMIEAGASTLLDPDRPQLRFASEEEAEACRHHLILTLPGSDEVWVVTREVGQVVDLAWDEDA